MAQTVKPKLSINQAQEVQILRSLVEITNSELALNNILKEVVEVVNLFTGADSVFIYLLDNKKENLVLNSKC